MVKRSKLIIIGAVATLIVLGLLYYSQPMPRYESPRFIGYRGNVTHTEPIDLSRLETQGLAAGYTIQHGNANGWIEAEFMEGPTPIDGTYISFVYTYSSNVTYFSFNFKVNDTRATEWLWGMVIDSLGLEGNHLERVRNDTYSTLQVDAGGAHVSCEVSGVPDWEKVMAFMGTLKSRDARGNVGRIVYTFESGAVAFLNDLSISVSTVVDGAKVGVVIDGDSDLYCYIDTDQKIGDPEALLGQVFRDLGLSESLLEEYSLMGIFEYLA